jgi:hypothetical protein
MKKAIQHLGWPCSNVDEIHPYFQHSELRQRSCQDFATAMDTVPVLKLEKMSEAG